MAGAPRQGILAGLILGSSMLAAPPALAFSLFGIHLWGERTDEDQIEVIDPLPYTVTHVGFNDIDALDAAITTETAAVFLEPIQGEAGIYPADDAFLQAARQLTRDRGALLIADEIQSGFRTGAPFAMSHAGVVPDIICTAKAVANGFPIGVTLVTDAISENVPAGAHGTTFGANPLACRAVVATLDAFERLKEAANTKGSQTVGAR